MGYALLQIALAHNSGQAYSDLLQQRLLKPLDMTHTGYTSQVKLTGYRKRQLVVVPELPLWQGYTGLNTTAADMVKYLKANLGLTQGQLPYVLELCHQSRAQTSATKNASQSVGMGWLIDGGVVPGHTVYWLHSSGFGHSAYIAFEKNTQTGVVLLSDSEAPLTVAGHELMRKLLGSQAQ